MAFGLKRSEKNALFHYENALTEKCYALFENFHLNKRNIFIRILNESNEMRAFEEKAAPGQKQKSVCVFFKSSGY